MIQLHLGRAGVTWPGLHDQKVRAVSIKGQRC
jgi:hypothetical protein